MQRYARKWRTKRRRIVMLGAMKTYKRHALHPHAHDRTLCMLAVNRGMSDEKPLAWWPIGITCRNCLTLYYRENAWAYSKKRLVGSSQTAEHDPAGMILSPIQEPVSST